MFARIYRRPNKVHFLSSALGLPTSLATGQFQTSPRDISRYVQCPSAKAASIRRGGKKMGSLGNRLKTRERAKIGFQAGDVGGLKRIKQLSPPHVEIC